MTIEQLNEPTEPTQEQIYRRRIAQLEQQVQDEKLLSAEYCRLYGDALNRIASQSTSEAKP